MYTARYDELVCIRRFNFQWIFFLPHKRWSSVHVHIERAVFFLGIMSDGKLFANELCYSSIEIPVRIYAKTNISNWFDKPPLSDWLVAYWAELQRKMPDWAEHHYSLYEIKFCRKAPKTMVMNLDHLNRTEPSTRRVLESTVLSPCDRSAFISRNRNNYKFDTRWVRCNL